jgi:predicted permease
MRDFKAFVRERVAPLALPPARERKIVEEWAAQLEELYDELRAGGLSDEEAWAAVLDQGGDWEELGRELLDAEPALTRFTGRYRPVREEARPLIVSSLVASVGSGLMGDVRAGLRLLWRDKAFTATVVLTLGICLGANAAIFSVVHAVLLQSSPIPDADRIVGVGDVYPTITPNDILASDVPSYFDRLAAVPALEDQAMFTFWYDTIVIDGTAEELRGMRATPSLFRLLRVPPALGRTFTDAEGELGPEHRIILSHGLWQRLYGGDPNVIGRDLRLGWTGKPYTIVGVMPAGFEFFQQAGDGHSNAGRKGVQFWIPLAFTPAQKSDAARTRYGFFHVGRLAPGATLEQAQAQIDALHAQIVARFPQFRLAELGMRTVVTPLHEALTRQVRRPLYLLWAAAGFVLVIGAINIANVAIARSTARARELATRLALGAGRVQLMRQLVIEALVPALLGGAAGIAVGRGILVALSSTGIENLPNGEDVSLNTVVVLWIGALALLTGIIIGAMPALAIGPRTLSRGLIDGGRAVAGGRAPRLLRRGLAVAQVALALVLLVGAALLLTSFQHLLQVDTGFRAAHVTTATIFPPPSRYPDDNAVIALTDRVLEAVRAIPAVESAGVTSNIALSGFASPSTVSVDQREPAPGEAAVIPSVVAISSGYFESLGTPLLRGRFFDERDRPDSLRVAIVDERLAARLWPNDDPLGKRLYRGNAGPYTVVGIVGEIRFEGLAARAESTGTAYFPHTQAPPLGRLRWIAIKTAGDDAAIVADVRTALAGIDPELPLADIQTMTERTSRSLAAPRLAVTLAGLCGAVALLLSMVGVYSVLAYLVVRRRREIGIRMALGSTVAGVFRLVFGEGLALVSIGLLLGLGGAVALGRVLESQLYGVQPNDPLILTSVAAATAVIALLACVAPAVRAARVDTVRVLNELSS